MTDVIYLSSVRLSFPHLAEPQRKISPETGKERISYSADFIMPPDHPGLKQFMERVAVMAQEKWKEHAPAVLQMINGDKRQRCYGDGNTKTNKNFIPWDGYAGNAYITAGRDNPPQVIQADGSKIDPNNSMAYQALTRAMYGGCRVNVAVKPWLQDNKHGRGVRADLVAIQFASDDKAFGEGTVDASAMFGAVATQAVASPAAPAAMPLPPFMMG